MRNLGQRRGEHFLRAILRVVEHFGCGRSQGLADHCVQVLGALDDLANVHLTLTEPPEDGRRVVQGLGALQLLDRLRALAGVGELHPFDAQRARSSDVLCSVIGSAGAGERCHEHGAQRAQHVSLLVLRMRGEERGL